MGRAPLCLTLGLTLCLSAGLAACSGSHRATRSPAAAAGPPASTASSAPPPEATAGTCPGSPAPGAAASGNRDVNPPGDIPDNQAFVSFSPPSGGWRVNVPEGWARREEGRAVIFSDRLNTIRIEVVGAPAPPTPDSARASEIPAIAGQVACFRAGTVDTVSRPAGQAVRITYRADAAPDTVTGKVVHDEVERYEFWHNGSEGVVTLSSPQGSDNVDPWRRVTDSFAWT